jgi:hypothetical protein
MQDWFLFPSLDHFRTEHGQPLLSMSTSSCSWMCLKSAKNNIKSTAAPSVLNAQINYHLKCIVPAFRILSTFCHQCQWKVNWSSGYRTMEFGPLQYWCSDVWNTCDFTFFGFAGSFQLLLVLVLVFFLFFVFFHIPTEVLILNYSCPCSIKDAVFFSEQIGSIVCHPAYISWAYLIFLLCIL